MSKEIPLNEWLKDNRIWNTGKDESMIFDLVFRKDKSDLDVENKVVTSRPYLYFYKHKRLVHWRRIK